MRKATRGSYGGLVAAVVVAAIAVLVPALEAMACGVERIQAEVGLTFSDLEHGRSLKCNTYVEVLQSARTYQGVAGVQNRFGSIFFTQLFFSFFGLQANLYYTRLIIQPCLVQQALVFSAPMAYVTAGMPSKASL